MSRTRVLGGALAAALASALALGVAQPSVATGSVKLADKAKNAQKVRGIGASRRPRPGMLLPLGRHGRFPASVLTNIVDSSLVQRPLTRMCPAGQSIRGISRMGAVTCQRTTSIVPPLVSNFTASVPLLDITNSGTGAAIVGKTTSRSRGDAIGAYNYGTDGYALWADLANANNPNAAIFARTAGGGRAIDAEVNSLTSSADALFARTLSSNPNSYAGFFSGNVKVTGNLNVDGLLSKGGGSFRIDHPLAPATRYLQHSFVESPDMKNIYDGVVTTDATRLRHRAPPALVPGPERALPLPAHHDPLLLEGDRVARGERQQLRDPDPAAAREGLVAADRHPARRLRQGQPGQGRHTKALKPSVRTRPSRVLPQSESVPPPRHDPAGWPRRSY